MRHDPRKLAVVAGLVLGVCSGCAPAGSGTLPSLIPVKGHVTYKGKPLATGAIRFEPDGYGRAAHGRIQADGTFVLTTNKESDGVVAGHHRVAVTETGITSPRDSFAKKYAGEASSGLTADVDAEHTEFTFDLK